ncbi:sensor histidine kinase [Salegentibacter sediminis]|uniref:sensor histidine kinase n=1 Tax=Salegentibacter sediminis TaxID=1930251 RepID=UPI0009BFAE13|nr:HAMP domain-containing sensor histidine kinase [Salegentibacter sediminis]
MPFNISLEEKLQERIKELSCLYKVSSAIREHNESVADTIEAIIHILKNAWRFPSQATVEIKIEDQKKSTGPVPDKSHFQESSIKLFKKNIGFIRVHYPSKDLSLAHFLIEEQRLLDKVAYEITLFLERLHVKNQEERIKQTAQRNDRLSILGEITAGIAHELNTPLGNILGFAEFIESKTTDKQIKKDAQKIIKAAVHSREVVKKLIFFSCEMPQNIQLTSIKPVVTQALALMEPNFKKAGISYELNYEDPELKMQIDPIQLTQVIFNLLINAIYHSPKGSLIKINIYRDDPNLFLEIADQGSGIKPENKSRIFEPFFTTKPIGEGSGLGLSVVHGIIKSHRGEIEALDNTPKGTIFKVRLPIKI